MSSDADYEAFLNKASSSNPAPAKSTPKDAKATTSSINTDVPSSLQKIDVYYTSDSDEPFEPVSLKWDGKKLPSAEELKKLLGHDADVESLSLKDFNPRGQYNAVIKAVEGESDDSALQAFRVAHGATRAEYYVVGLDAKKGRVVGLKAKAVES